MDPNWVFLSQGVRSLAPRSLIDLLAQISRKNVGFTKDFTLHNQQVIPISLKSFWKAGDLGSAVVVALILEPTTVSR